MSLPRQSRPVVILIGDSIRLSYQDRVRARLDREAEVWAPEENGQDSRNLLAHLEEWFLGRGADLIHVNCGLHDIKRPRDGGSGYQVPPDAYRKNLARLFDQTQAHTSADLVWASTTPVVESRHRQRGNFGFDRFEGDVADYNRIASIEARRRRIAIDPLHDVVRRHGPEDLIGDDGVHFTPEGTEILGDQVAGFIRARLARALAAVP